MLLWYTGISWIVFTFSHLIKLPNPKAIIFPNYVNSIKNMVFPIKLMQKKNYIDKGILLDGGIMADKDINKVWRAFRFKVHICSKLWHRWRNIITTIVHLSPSPTPFILQLRWKLIFSPSKMMTDRKAYGETSKVM